MRAAAALAALLLLGAAPAGFRLDGPAVQGALVRGAAPTGTVALALDREPLALAPDGRFLIGFDRDHDGEAVLAARLADGREIRETIRVAPRDWEIEHVDLSRRQGRSSAEFLRIRRGELTRIGEARARRTESGGWIQEFVWPATGRITGRFGAQRIYRGEPGSYHTGVDIAAGAGAAVVAPADGVVVLAPPPMFSLEGNLVIVDHGMGLNSAFLHLASARVREGQRVARGEPIGTVGATGRATGPHLHWSLAWNGARLDPEAAAGPMR